MGAERSAGRTDGDDERRQAFAYTFGYMAAVPLLTTLTDRIDARRILTAGSVLSGAATVLFGLVDGLSRRR